ncbi:MAG: hypothetical protein QM762_15755 [Chryseolinea sp.]
MGISSKLFWAVLLAVGGTCYVIVRKITSAVSRVSTSGLISALKRDPEKAKEVVDGLDIPYARRENFSRGDFEILRSVLQTASTIGDFSILHSADVDTFQQLLITEIKYTDFDVDVTGKPTDIQKKAYHYFVLKFDADSQSLNVWSHLYEDSTSKFQKEAFAKRIVNPLSEQ